MIDSEFEDNFLRLQKGVEDSLVEYSKAMVAGDQEASLSAGQQLVAYEQESRAALKKEGRKFEAECKLNPTDDDNMKAAQLLRAFVRGARLTRLWRDSMDQSRISSCCAGKVFKVAGQLDAMGKRGDFVQFLDHPDLEVRAKAAACLVAKMPERCLPILKEIAGQGKSRCAQSSAIVSLIAHEHGDSF